MIVTHLKGLRLSAAAYCSILFILLTVVAASAQNIENPQSAVDNLMRSNLHVDEATGAMQMQIPLGAYPGRGEASLPITLSYSSKVWNTKYLSTIQCSGEPVSAYFADYAHSSASGWTSSIGWFAPSQDVTLEKYDQIIGKPSNTGSRRVARVYVTLPDGSRHELRRDDATHALNEDFSGMYYAVDGSRLSYDLLSGTIYMPNGSRIMNSGGNIQYVDRNGNYLSYNSSTATWTDTLGRSFSLPVPGAAPPAGDYSYTLPAPNGAGMTYHLVWRNLADALTDPSQPLHYKGDSASADCSVGNHLANNLFSTIDDQQKVLQSGIFNPVVLYQIVLPNGTS